MERDDEGAGAGAPAESADVGAARPPKQKAREKLAGLAVDAGQDGYSRVAPNRWSSITNMLMKLRYKLRAPMIALRAMTSELSSS